MQEGRLAASNAATAGEDSSRAWADRLRDTPSPANLQRQTFVIES
jgi:hypothetical protein